MEIDIHSQNMSTKTNFCHNICWLCWRFFPSKKSMPQAMRADQLSCDSDQTDPQRSIFCCWGPDFNLESKKWSKCTKNWPQSRKTISKSLEKNSKIRAFSRFSSPFRIGVKTQWSIRLPDECASHHWNLNRPTYSVELFGPQQKFADEWQWYRYRTTNAHTHTHKSEHE